MTFCYGETLSLLPSRIHTQSLLKTCWVSRYSWSETPSSLSLWLCLQKSVNLIQIKEPGPQNWLPKKRYKSLTKFCNYQKNEARVPDRPESDSQERQPFLLHIWEKRINSPHVHLSSGLSKCQSVQFIFSNFCFLISLSMLTSHATGLWI